MKSGDDVYADVFFGTDPDDLDQVVDGGLNTNETTREVPGAGTYYWRVDSHLDGDPDGSPVTGDLFFFVVTDSDGDGLPDDFERDHTDPESPTALDPDADDDGDGLTNLEEFTRGTDPGNGDSDGDGLADGVESATGTWVGSSDTGTHPLIEDTDDDGLADGVETNTGTWVDAADTGTDPTKADTDGDGLVDGVEINIGTDPHDRDTDGDGVWDWYEVAAAFTDPDDAADSPDVPYPLPDPDPADTGAADVPVKVYIMSGQSNTVGIGRVNGTEPGTLDTIARRGNKFPNLVDASGNWTERNDVIYKGVVTATAEGPLTAGQGASSSQLGPELGFGHVVGWFHDEPVLIIKASQGNRSLGWDFLPPGSGSWEVGNTTYPGYGQSPQSWPTVGGGPAPGGWYAGKQYDDALRDESAMGMISWATGTDYPEGALVRHNGAPYIAASAHTADGSSEPGTGANWQSLWTPYETFNAADILDLANGVLRNLPTSGNDLNGRSFEIAGFVWWQGHKDQGSAIYAPRYETHLVGLIDALRADFNAPDAPVVVGSIGFGGGDLSDKSANFVDVYNAQMAVGDPAQYPELSGTVKSVDILPYWRDADASPTNQDFHYNQNAETYMLAGDAMGRAMLGLQNDVAAPNPDPMTFDLGPNAVDTSTVGMVATAASDPSGPVEYFFENTTTGDTSGWSTATRWDHAGLSNGVNYDFRVKARDAEGNETAWSAAVTAAPGEDVTAPSPDPMSFAGPPEALGEDSIAMTATSALDVNGVEYYFECTVGGAPDSGWVADPQYTAAGFNPGTEYTFVVRARDSVGNTTGDSAPASATTEEPDLTAPSVSSFSPAPGSANVPVDTALVATFDEDIAVGTGSVILRNLTDGTAADLVIDVADSVQVSVSGANLTIDPSTDLAAGTTYAVRIDATAIDDLVGNSYAGISDDTSWTFSTPEPPPVGLLLSEDFESPDVDAAASTGNTSGTVPDNGNWVGASQGFGSGRRGIVDEAAGAFTDPTGEQAFAFRYTNSGLTSAFDAIGSLTSGTTYTVSFDVVADSGATPYNMQFVTFDGAGTRDDIRSDSFVSKVLVAQNGNAPDDGSYQTVSFDFTPDSTLDAGVIGHDLAVRFKGATTSATIDNVSVSSTGGGGNAFADWIAGFSGLGGLTGFSDDPDSDGIGNGLENYFGTDPGVFSTGVVAGAASGGTFSFTHPIGDAPADDVSASYLWSKDLVNFHADGATVDGTTVTFSPGTPSAGMVSVTATVGGTPVGRLFVIVEATQN